MCNQSAYEPQSSGQVLVSYCSIARALKLLYKAHQEDLGSCGLPVARQMLLSLGANIVVGRLQRLQQLGQFRLNIRGKD